MTRITTVLLKNFPEFYGTLNFIIVLMKALNWPPSSSRSIHSIPLHAICTLMYSVSYDINLVLDPRGARVRGHVAWRATASLIHGRWGELLITRKHQGGRVQPLHTHQARNSKPATYRGTHSRKLWGHTHPVLGFHEPSGVSIRHGKWITHKISI
jgi:hypothetical protein